MEIYNKFKLNNNKYEDKNNLNFEVNNLYNAILQEENEKKFDTLLDGILSNNISNIKNRRN